MPTNSQLNKYCSKCQKLTPHQQIPTAYATACAICGQWTNELVRKQAESHTFNAPDGTKATVVENTPNRVTYYVPTGKYKGYYHYDKNSKAKRIEQA